MSTSDKQHYVALPEAVAAERARLAQILRACPCDHCTKCALIVEDGTARDRSQKASPSASNPSPSEDPAAG